jgi:hypothetical protein
MWMWGFTVDDALIAVRYARHVAAGVGWRFNVGGPSTDGVTPLPWPLLLAPLASGADALTVLARAKTAGLLAWAGAGAALGWAAGGARDSPAWARVAALATLGLSVPVAAHAASGMETGLAMSLATGAALLGRRPCAAAILAGLSASLRPEMAPWACALAAGFAIAARQGALRALATAGVALAPFVACALVRLAVWGRPAPLAVLAKPSDLEHGLAYVGAGCVVTLTPLLVLAPNALRCAPVGLAIAIAFVVHLTAVAAVGGDWMPFARLIVPVVPSLAWAAVLAATRARAEATAVRAVLAIGLGVVVVALQGGRGRNVMTDRAALIAAARPWLRDARRVAALDVGWAGAATEADIVDLAGLTDPEIAALPGGHTSKRVGGVFLRNRAPDALLLYASAGLPGGRIDAWRDAAWSRVVEQRLASDDVVARHFAPVAWLPLGVAGAGYVLLRASEPRTP